MKPGTPKIKRIIRQTLKFALLFFILALAFVFYANYTVRKTASPFLYTDTSAIPARKAALLLGTAEYLGDGRRNLYFSYRIDAAYQLYKAGKIRYIILSGDNSRKDYNEPEAMKQALLKLGVPDSVMYCDYAGFRTFDSVIRSNCIFGQDSVTIISQPFHNERAVYIARSKGLPAIAYNAKDVSKAYGFKVRMREYLARANMLLDLNVLNTEPKFLGEKVTLK